MGKTMISKVMWTTLVFAILFLLCTIGASGLLYAVHTEVAENTEKKVRQLAVLFLVTDFFCWFTFGILAMARLIMFIWN